MDVGGRQEFGYSQTPDKEERQNQNQIWKENNQKQNQSAELAKNLTMVQDLVTGAGAISWLDVEDFLLPDEALASPPEFSFPPSPNILASAPAMCPSSSSPISTQPFLGAPNCAPESVHRGFLEMTMQPHASNSNMPNETQFGMDTHGSADSSNLSVPWGSSDLLMDDILMVDNLGACADQSFNLDLPCPGFHGANKRSGVEGKEKEEGDDLAKFFLEWLKKNRDDISLEDLRSIRFKKSTIECAAQRLGAGPRSRFQLVKLILDWVQNYHLKNKRRRLQALHINGCNNPMLLFNEVTIDNPIGPWAQSNTGFQCSPMTYQPGLQQTQYVAAPISPFYHQGQDTTRISEAAIEARKNRMERQRKMSYQKTRALGQSGDAVLCGLVGQQHNGDTGDQAFWSSLAAYSEQVMGMDLNLMSGGSSSNSQATQAIQGSNKRESSMLQPRGSVTVRQQGFKCHEKDIKYVLEKTLKQSDIGGHIVLPKKDAELYMPELDSRDGIIIPMEDMRTSRVWNMHYRFWPNNRSRMYVLENTGEFIRANGLEVGDIVVIYHEVKSGKYMIKGIKNEKPQEERDKVEEAHV